MGSGNCVQKPQIYVYRVDRADRLVAVSGNWLDFAEENDWSKASPVAAADALGHPLWRFIEGPQTTHLYQILMSHVRSRREALSIPFRCDSPGTRRMFELTLSPLDDDGIEFRSVLRHIEPRDCVPLLVAAEERTAPPLRICSSCKKIALNGDEWVEAEEAIRRLRIFDTKTQPQLTHGFCPECFEVAMRQIRQDRGQPTF